jgi:hypothetical protein
MTNNDDDYDDDRAGLLSLRGLTKLGLAARTQFRAYMRTLQAHEPNRLWTLLPNLSTEGTTPPGQL